MEEAWKLLEESIIYYQGRPIGTVAAQDSEVEALNYDQCFIRDFVPSALVFLMHGKTEIVRNFLIETLAMQSHDKEMDCFAPGPGLMPASFKVEHDGEREYLEADFGESAIARVPPVDSCLWWILLLRAYAKATGDFELAYRPIGDKLRLESSCQGDLRRGLKEKLVRASLLVRKGCNN